MGEVVFLIEKFQIIGQCFPEFLLKIFPDPNQLGYQVPVFVFVKVRIEPESQHIHENTGLVQDGNPIVQAGQVAVIVIPVFPDFRRTGVEQIFLDGPVKDKRRLGDKTGIVHHVLLRQIRHLLISQKDRSAAVFIQLSDALGQGALPAAGKPHQGHLIAGIE